MAEIGVDPACYDLADHFLADDPKPTTATLKAAEATRKSLAEEIQQAVEDWFFAREHKGKTDA